MTAEGQDDEEGSSQVDHGWENGSDNQAGPVGSNDQAGPVGSNDQAGPVGSNDQVGPVLLHCAPSPDGCRLEYGQEPSLEFFQPSQDQTAQHPKPVPVLCRFFMLGRCAKGLNCQFLHDSPETVSPRIAWHTMMDVPEPIPGTSCKVPCRFFEQGRCQRGDRCGFSHVLEQTAIPLEKKFTLECEFYAQGKCTRRDSCPFAHGPQELYEIEMIQQRINKEGSTSNEDAQLS